MTGPDPAVQAVRLAVRRDLLGTASIGDTLLVACSGGADSLALLAATVFEAREHGCRVIGVTVDHGLQDGSEAGAASVVAQMAGLGADETASIRVTVDPGPGGIEAGARAARYAALEQLAEHFGAGRVLLGHTRDDQAETVLLGLTRGSGGRSIAGMRRGWYPDLRSGTPDAGGGPFFSRPLLEVTRAQTEAACRAAGIEFWIDPHNSDPRFTRSRIRHTVLPVLEAELGPGVAAALARTGEMLQEDLDTLEEIAERAWRECHDGNHLDTLRLDALDGAIKHRLVRRAALEAGAVASELTRDHVLAIAGLLQGGDRDTQVQLPGRVTAYREGDRLRFRPTPVSG